MQFGDIELLTNYNTKILRLLLKMYGRFSIYLALLYGNNYVILEQYNSKHSNILSSYVYKTKKYTKTFQMLSVFLESYLKNDFKINDIILNSPLSARILSDLK